MNYRLKEKAVSKQIGLETLDLILQHYAIVP